MAITQEDIQNKQFSIKSRGYDKYEVDVFLDEITDQFAAYENELNALKEKLSMMYGQLKSYKEKEGVVVELMQFAQTRSDEIINEANARAASIVTTAERDCEEVCKQLSEKKDYYMECAEKAKADYYKLQAELEAVLESHVRFFRESAAKIDSNWEERINAARACECAVEEEYEAAVDVPTEENTEEAAE
ncbi:MAG: DivIVA domain-containing protein [Clostridiales bacterium]|nr:DivIVA domain-containing protein [Clostridiales bacterium]